MGSSCLSHCGRQVRPRQNPQEIAPGDHFQLLPVHPQLFQPVEEVPDVGGAFQALCPSFPGPINSQKSKPQPTCSTPMTSAMVDGRGGPGSCGSAAGARRGQSRGRRSAPPRRRCPGCGAAGRRTGSGAHRTGHGSWSGMRSPARPAGPSRPRSRRRSDGTRPHPSPVLPSGATAPASRPPSARLRIASGSRGPGHGLVAR